MYQMPKSMLAAGLVMSAELIRNLRSLGYHVELLSAPSGQPGTIASDSRPWLIGHSSADVVSPLPRGQSIQ